MKSVQVITTVLCTVSLVLSLITCSTCSEAAVMYLDSFAAPSQENTAKTVEKVAKEKEQNTATVSIQSTAAAKTISATEKRLGKVYSRFFSPYTANTAYNNTYVNNQSGEKINIKDMLSKYKSTVDCGKKEPQVLIMHTHATETYTAADDYYTASDLERSAEPKRSVIGIGNTVADILQKGGVSVIHDKTQHDNPSYNGSYDRGAETVAKYLKKYPTISVVLDIHRDAIADGDDLIKPQTEINGKKAAQVMICVGSQTGSVESFPKWRENLKFGVKLQQALEVLYPGLARALFLAKDRCYNQNLSSGSLIIEFGTNGNTFDEANYSAKLVGNALLTVFKNT